MKYKFIIILVVLMYIGACQNNEYDKNGNQLDNIDTLSSVNDTISSITDIKVIDQYPSIIDSFIRQDVKLIYSNDSIRKVTKLAYHPTTLRTLQDQGEIYSSELFLDTAKIFVEIDVILNNNSFDTWIYRFDTHGNDLGKVKLPKNNPDFKI